MRESGCFEDGYTTDDQDCDDADPGLGLPLEWIVDADGDGYGGSTVEACFRPDGAFDLAEDCDDTRVDVYPGAPEVCRDGARNDCDAVTMGHCEYQGRWQLALAGARLVGDAESAHAGEAVVSPGDFDGDGGPDVVVYSRALEREGRDGVGAIYVVSDAPRGTQQLADAAPLAIYNSYEAGFSEPAAAGDADGDGRVDLLVGSSRFQAAVLIGGTAATGELDLTDVTDVIFEGSTAGAEHSGLGDLNGDGVAEVGVSVWSYEEGRVGLHVMSPPFGASASTSADSAALVMDNGEAWPATFAAGGDLDGDGASDVVVGCYSSGRVAPNGGAVFIFSDLLGADSMHDADALWSGGNQDQWAGHAVESAGDVNADGYGDLLVASQVLRDGTRVEQDVAASLLLGPITADGSLAEAAGTYVCGAEWFACGMAVSAAGDMDGDGFDELAVQAGWIDDTLRGGVALFYGPSSGVHELGAADVFFEGEGINTDYTGTAIDGGHDFDQDGLDDLLIGNFNFGKYGYDGELAGQGITYVIYGGEAW